MKKIILPIVVLATILASCENTASDTQSNQDTTTTNTATPEVNIVPTTPGPEFPNATLEVANISGKVDDKSDSISITINYNVKNYELKSQTSDATDRTCNNSKDGQHIHFILDNGPYSALYEPTHTFKVAKNSEHYLLSFLSRSYHLSLKNESAYKLIKFKVDEKGTVTNLDVEKTPMIFYSRPKGTYIGNDTKDVLLDFYVVNTNLNDGHKVVANINGKEIKVSTWQPYYINNLPMGENTVSLQLLDNQNNKISSANNNATRKFTLAESEPIAQ